MDKDQLRILLEQVQSGKTSVDGALSQLKTLPYKDLGFAKIDTHRALRRGFPEVIFCEGKTVEQVSQIVEHMLDHTNIILGMRANQDVFEGVQKVTDKVAYHADARAIVVGDIPKPKTKGLVLVVAAGTADLPVAEEAALTARVMGNQVEQLSDVGVAGVHRLLKNVETLHKANVIVVVAGMEGALPGVVAGLVDKPVVAVPTSVGYGTNFGGVSALLTMLNSCAPGIGVVNIDNGFGAGYMATLINKLGDPAE